MAYLPKYLPTYLPTQGNKPIYEWNSVPNVPSTYNFSMYTTNDTYAYYVYMANSIDIPQPLIFNFSALPGVQISSYYLVSTTSDYYHGEVSEQGQLTSGKFLTWTQPKSSVVMMTIPKGVYGTKVLTASADTSIFAGKSSSSTVMASTVQPRRLQTTEGSSSPANERKLQTTMTGGASTILRIGTTTTSTQNQTSVALVKFDLTGIDTSKLISAVLSFTQAAPLNSSSAQILSVLGINSTWAEATATWDSAVASLGLSTLPDGSVVNSINTNFVNWNASAGSTPVAIVGHLTAGASVNISLDVVDYLLAGNDASFMLLRQYR